MKDLIQDKHGQTGIVAKVLTGFVIVGVVLFLLVLLIYVFGTVHIGLESTADNQSVINDTGGINASGYQLALGLPGEPRTFSIVNAQNATHVIASTEYQVSSAGVVTNTSAAAEPGYWTDVNFTYTYVNNSAEQTASRDAQTNTSRSIPLVGILLIILAVGALITILIVSFTTRRTRS